MESENVGILLHKLTKYQTLLANSNERSKMSTYRQKMNQYTSKLENLGVDRSTLAQIGGLAGEEKYEKVLQGLINLQSTKLQNRINSLKSGTTAATPTDVTDIESAARALIDKKNDIDTAVNATKTNINVKVADAQIRVDAGIAAYSGTIETLVKLIRKLLEELIKLETDLENIGVPNGIDLSSIRTAINDVNTALTSFAVDSNIADSIDSINLSTPNIDNEIVNTYAKLLIDDINADNGNKFVYSGKHTNLLSVELRQLATLMDLKQTDTEFANTLKKQFSNTETDLGKITDQDKQKALEKLIDGDPSASPVIEPFKNKFITTAEQYVEKLNTNK